MLLMDAGIAKIFTCKWNFSSVCGCQNELTINHLLPWVQQTTIFFVCLFYVAKLNGNYEEINADWSRNRRKSITIIMIVFI